MANLSSFYGNTVGCMITDTGFDTCNRRYIFSATSALIGLFALPVGAFAGIARATE
jgi:hypothetical protein